MIGKNCYIDYRNISCDIYTQQLITCCNSTSGVLQLFNDMAKLFYFTNNFILQLRKLDQYICFNNWIVWFANILVKHMSLRFKYITLWLHLVEDVDVLESSATLTRTKSLFSSARLYFLLFVLWLNHIVDIFQRHLMVLLYFFRCIDHDAIFRNIINDIPWTWHDLAKIITPSVFNYCEQVLGVIF